MSTEAGLQTHVMFLTLPLSTVSKYLQNQGQSTDTELLQDLTN